MSSPVGLGTPAHSGAPVDQGTVGLPAPAHLGTPGLLATVDLGTPGLCEQAAVPWMGSGSGKGVIPGDRAVRGFDRRSEEFDDSDSRVMTPPREKSHDPQKMPASSVKRMTWKTDNEPCRATKFIPTSATTIINYYFNY